jgi:hypothetical protein
MLNRFIRISLWIFSSVIIFCSCKKDNSQSSDSLVDLHDPVLDLQFYENPVTHNMHIASDGSYYYTCNGGTYYYGRINQYSLDGTWVATYQLLINMRSIMYNKSDGYFYVCGFESTNERNIYKITDMSSGTFTKVLSNVYDDYESSTAISNDGKYIYAQSSDTVKKYKLSDGTLVKTISGLSSDNSAVAVDPDYIYTCNSSTKTVYVYDYSGNLVKTMTLSYGIYDHSLSFVNGILFVSEDGNYFTGTWYGFNIRKSIS